MSSSTSEHEQLQFREKLKQFKLNKSTNQSTNKSMNSNNNNTSVNRTPFKNKTNMSPSNNNKAPKTPKLFSPRSITTTARPSLTKNSLSRDSFGRKSLGNNNTTIVNNRSSIGRTPITKRTTTTTAITTKTPSVTESKLPMAGRMSETNETINRWKMEREARLSSTPYLKHTKAIFTPAPTSTKKRKSVKKAVAAFPEIADLHKTIQVATDLALRGDSTKSRQLFQNMLDMTNLNTPAQKSAFYWVSRAQTEELLGNFEEVIRLYEVAEYEHHAQPVSILNDGLRKFMISRLQDNSTQRDTVDTIFARSRMSQNYQQLKSQLEQDRREKQKNTRLNKTPGTAGKTVFTSPNRLVKPAVERATKTLEFTSIPSSAQKKKKKIVDDSLAMTPDTPPVPETAQTSDTPLGGTPSAKHRSPVSLFNTPHGRDIQTLLLSSKKSNNMNDSEEIIELVAVPATEEQKKITGSEFVLSPRKVKRRREITAVTVQQKQRSPPKDVEQFLDKCNYTYNPHNGFAPGFTSSIQQQQKRQVEQNVSASNISSSGIEPSLMSTLFEDDEPQMQQEAISPSQELRAQELEKQRQILLFSSPESEQRTPKSNIPALVLEQTPSKATLSPVQLLAPVITSSPAVMLPEKNSSQIVDQEEEDEDEYMSDPEDVDYDPSVYESLERDVTIDEADICYSDDDNESESVADKDEMMTKPEQKTQETNVPVVEDKDEIMDEAEETQVSNPVITEAQILVSQEPETVETNELEVPVSEEVNVFATQESIVPSLELSVPLTHITETQEMQVFKEAVSVAETQEVNVPISEAQEYSLPVSEVISAFITQEATVPQSLELSVVPSLELSVPLTQEAETQVFKEPVFVTEINVPVSDEFSVFVTQEATVQSLELSAPVILQKETSVVSKSISVIAEKQQILTQPITQEISVSQSAEHHDEQCEDSDEDDDDYDPTMHESLEVDVSISEEDYMITEDDEEEVQLSTSSSESETSSVTITTMEVTSNVQLPVEGTQQVSEPVFLPEQVPAILELALEPSQSELQVNTQVSQIPQLSLELELQASDGCDDDEDEEMPDAFDQAGGGFGEDEETAFEEISTPQIPPAAEHVSILQVPQQQQEDEALQRISQPGHEIINDSSIATGTLKVPAIKTSPSRVIVSRGFAVRSVNLRKDRNYCVRVNPYDIEPRTNQKRESKTRAKRKINVLYGHDQ
jgi:hypothetical protein